MNERVSEDLGSRHCRPSRFLRASYDNGSCNSERPRAFVGSAAAVSLRLIQVSRKTSQTAYMRSPWPLAFVFIFIKVETFNSESTFLSTAFCPGSRRQALDAQIADILSSLSKSRNRRANHRLLLLLLR